MSDRGFATLSLLFAGRDWSDCTLVAAAPADLGIVDLDTPTPDRTWHEYRKRHPALPTLVLSLVERPLDNAWPLKKPFDAAALRRAVDMMRHAIDAPVKPSRPRATTATTTADSATGTSPPPASEEPARVPPPAADARTDGAPSAFVPLVRRAKPARAASTQEAATTMNRELEERNCGHAADADFSDGAAAARAIYDPPRYLQGALERAMSLARQTGKAHSIVGLPESMTVLPGHRLSIATTLKESVLRSTAVVALRPGSVTVAPIDGSVTAAPAVPAEVMLWQIALWTARGRLRRGVAPDQPLQLTRWPNFTRQIETPHAMRIAALLVSAPHTPLDVARILGIPQRYVFSVVSATVATGLVQRDRPNERFRTVASTTPAQVAAPARAAASGHAAGRLPPAARGVAAHRTILARILMHLVPGH